MQVVTDAQPPQDGPSTGGWEPAGPPVETGRQLRELLADDAWLDELIERAGDGGVRLTGEGGFFARAGQRRCWSGGWRSSWPTISATSGGIRPAGARRTPAPAASRKRWRPRSGRCSVAASGQ